MIKRDCGLEFWINLSSKTLSLTGENHSGFLLLNQLNNTLSNTRQKNRRSSTKKKYRKRKREVFLNRYHFAYAGRAVVNQFKKFALKLMKIASSEINNIAQQRTNQVICQGRQEIERILPKKIFTEPYLSNTV